MSNELTGCVLNVMNSLKVIDCVYIALSNVNYAPKIGSSDFTLSACEWWTTLTISWNILFQLTSRKSIFSLCEIRQSYLIVKGGHFHHIKRDNILRDVVDHHLRLISPKLNDPVLESS